MYRVLALWSTKQQKNKKKQKQVNNEDVISGICLNEEWAYPYLFAQVIRRRVICVRVCDQKH